MPSNRQWRNPRVTCNRPFSFIDYEKALVLSENVTLQNSGKYRIVEKASDKGTPSHRNYLQNLLRGHSGSFTGKSEGVEKMGNV